MKKLLALSFLMLSLAFVGCEEGASPAAGGGGG